ncbi:hypothetical protein [Streptomyces sp. NPDC005907]|uniref:hypothetical protein n=1 Tax=Streptomyces sp. NPDC005907 TaxID=3154571 RepID=UPI0033E1F08A
MNWTRETLRSGVELETASDDFGAMGTPGTWYRVRQGERVSHPTRSRGDALRHFQRRVRLAQGPCPTCFGRDGHHVQCPKFLTD